MLKMPEVPSSAQMSESGPPKKRAHGRYVASQVVQKGITVRVGHLGFAIDSAVQFQK